MIDSTSAQAHLGRARAALDMGRWDTAMREAGLGLAADPENADGHFLLAFALHRADRDGEALEAIGRGLQKAPHWAGLHQLHSDVLRALSRSEDAMAAAEEALRLDVEDPRSHCAVGLSAAHQGDHDRAIHHFQRAVAIAPEDAYLHRLLGDAHLARNEDAAAEACYREALGMDPTDAPTLNNLGVALNKQNRPEEAAVAFKSALLQDPTLHVAKTNTRDTMRHLLGGVGILGAAGLVALKIFKGKIVLLFVVMHQAFRSWQGWAILAAVLAGSAAFILIRRRVRLRRLEKKDPQLLAIFEKLQAEHKAGRL